MPRPISPHLQIYRAQLTSTLSILHRLTGLWLTLTATVLVFFAVALANGPDAYSYASRWLPTYGGQMFFFIGLACFYFHLANGIRHLAWDMGWGFRLRVAYLSGWLVVAVAMVATIFTWLLGSRP